MNIDNAKILFLLNATPDGGGDFSFGSKIVSNLKNMGIKKENIYIVLQLDDSFINEYINFNKLLKSNCLDKQLISDDQFILTDQDICTLKNITISICDTYKYLYNNDKDDFCYLNRPSENDYKIITHELDEKEYNTKNMNLQNHFERQIKEIIDRNLKSGKCSVDRDSLLNFYNKFVTNDLFKIWIVNTIKFFLSVEIKTSNYIYVSDFKNLTPEKINFKPEDVPNTVIITFLYVQTLENFEEYKQINLVEVGDPLFSTYPSNTYTLGFAKNPRYLGINIVKDFVEISILDLFNKPNKFSKIITNNNYNVCYFGGTTILPSVYNFLMLYKLKAFCEIVTTENHSEEYNIFIPYNSFAFISEYKNIAKSAIPNLTIKDNNTLNITTSNDSSVNLLYFKELTRDEFLNFINKSNDFCVLTGDQSFYEGVSLGKKVIYDVLPHKTFLYKQYLNKLNSFTQTNDPDINDYIDDLNLDFFVHSFYNKNILSSAISDTNPIIDDNISYEFSDNNFEIKLDGENIYELDFFSLSMLYDINSSLIQKANKITDINGNTFVDDIILNNNFDDKFYKIVTNTLNNTKTTEIIDLVDDEETNYDYDYDSDSSYDSSNDKYFYKYIKYKHKYLLMKSKNKI